MKAPNGKPTKLTERQWVQVRPPAFKRWFGDWEAASHREFLEGKPIKSIPGDQFPDDGGKLSEKVSAWYKENDLTVVNVLHIGEVSLDHRAVKNSIWHGLGKAKAEAFAAVPDILRFGRIVDQNISERDKNLTVFVLAAPIRIAQQDYIGVVLVRADSNTKRMYVHEVVLKEKLQHTAFKTEASTTGDSALNGAAAGAIKRVIQNIYAVNDVSKVVDENGEPLVVYHNTNKESREFDPSTWNKYNYWGKWVGWIIHTYQSKFQNAKQSV